jgi:putative transposase
LAIRADKSISGAGVVTTLNRVKATRGPEFIRIDNGPEFISKAVDLWAYQEGVRLQFSRPGKPTDNAMSKSFNGSSRSECLATNWFLSIQDARSKIKR